jgi:hypothetical protein
MILTFSKEPDGSVLENNQPHVAMSFKSQTLLEIVLNFEDFLRGRGFHFEGHLELVNEPTVELQKVMPHVNNAFDAELAHWDEPEVTAEE